MESPSLGVLKTHLLDAILCTALGDPAGQGVGLDDLQGSLPTSTIPGLGDVQRCGAIQTRKLMN